MNVKLIDLEDIHADGEFNCRGIIAPIDVADLAKDIERQGLLQPVIICEYPPELQTSTGHKYKLIAGYRRFTAHIILSRTVISASIHDKPYDESEIRVLNLQENLQRENLDFMEEANAIKKIMGMNTSEAKIMEKLGKSRGWVQMRMLALKLPPVIQAEIKAGYVNQSDIRDVYSVYLHNGEEAVFEAVRQIKDAKIKGKKFKPTIKKKSDHATAKHHRKRQEIFELMEHIQESAVGNGDFTRALAWAAGEISLMEFIETLKIYATKHNIDYVPLDLS